MNKAKFTFKSQGNYIAGQFVRPSEPNGEWSSRSPADFTDEVAKFHYSYKSVDEAVASARKAFASWRKTALSDRAELLKKYQAAIKRREEELNEAIAREVGKPLWETKTEISAMVNKVDVTITESMKLVSDF